MTKTDFEDDLIDFAGVLDAEDEVITIGYDTLFKVDKRLPKYEGIVIDCVYGIDKFFVECKRKYANDGNGTLYSKFERVSGTFSCQLRDAYAMEKTNFDIKLITYDPHGDSRYEAIIRDCLVDKLGDTLQYRIILGDVIIPCNFTAKSMTGWTKIKE